ncbi:hypothetical protein BGZ61DRAFT_462476 [Ilyonectria robusta]|uniref:uncharacterized protein n=1 Tax=Ilyonectria robusta TaxID=1079257 RepID=UPI001E8D474D|nr:uncharacterized protein BGZ61DRAFT_462476 [Ilyonectria robusta]KAH8664872.1 hypothetical protein BGZ61DRAFT_462476 [Ilyonectria robusta]
MDPASLVLATLVLIKPICTTIHTALTNYSLYARDANSLSLRFSLQQTRLESLQVVLTEDKLIPGVRGRLVDNLSPNTLHILNDLVQELHYILNEYVALKMHREVLSTSSGDQVSRALEEAGHSPGPASQYQLQSYASGIPNSLATTKMKLISTTRRLQWSISRRDTVEGVVTSFEEWTERTKALVETLLWSIPVNSPMEQIRVLQRDEDASNIGLLDGIKIRELLAASPAFAESHVNGLYSRAFEERYTVGGFNVGTIHQKEGLFLIEYKHGGTPGEEGINHGTRQQVIRLAALLHEAPSADEGLGVLNCTNYIEDLTSNVLGIVYALPSAYTTSSLPPKTLSSLLLQTTVPKTSLDVRIRIACNIAYTVHRLHIYGWVHKSLRSDNILFFPLDPSNNDRGYDLSKPKILGFDWARKEDEISPEDPGLEIKHNIYRHPQRWGQPTSRFDKTHDIYALGVILLELGLGESVARLDGGALMRNQAYHDPTVMNRKLLQHASLRIGFYGGTRLRDIVTGCLTGEWRGSSIVHQLPDVVMCLMSIAMVLSEEEAQP